MHVDDALPPMGAKRSAWGSHVADVCTYHDSSVAPRFEYAEHTTCGASCVTLGLECAEVDMSGVGAGNGYKGRRRETCEGLRHGALRLHVRVRQ